MFYNRLLSGPIGRSFDPGLAQRQGGYVAEPFRAKAAIAQLQLPSVAGSAAPPQRLPVVRVRMTQSGPQVTGAQARLPAPRARAASDVPRTAFQLTEECSRLRAEIDQLRQENRRLSDENARLRGEAPRSRSSSGDLDDSVQRFKLLELE